MIGRKGEEERMGKNVEYFRWRMRLSSFSFIVAERPLCL